MTMAVALSPPWYEVMIQHRRTRASCGACAEPRRRGVMRRLPSGRPAVGLSSGIGSVLADSRPCDGGVRRLDGPRRASGVPLIPVRSVGIDEGIGVEPLEVSHLL